MKDIFDIAEEIADSHPKAKWVEAMLGDKRYGFAIWRGIGLELTVNIYVKR